MQKGSSYVKILEEEVNQYVEQRAGEMGTGPQAIGKAAGLIEVAMINNNDSSWENRDNS